MTLKELDAIYYVLDKMPEPEFDDFSFIFKLFNKKKFDDIKNLDNVSIGTILKATHCEKPSDVVKLLLNELNFLITTQNDKCLIFFYIKNKIEQITNIIASINSIHPITSKFSSLYESIEKQYNISSDVLLIDNISKRQGISWSEAEKLKWSEVYFMMMIDAQTQAFEFEVNKTLTRK